jgi:2'-5' RNA ligase
MRPFFATFDDAWAWFSGGGELTTFASTIDDVTKGRAQFLGFAARVTNDAAVGAVLAAQDALVEVDGLVMLPADYLHVTLLTLGFQVIEKTRPDEILRQDIGAVAERAARVLAATPPAEVVVGPVNVFSDAVITEVHDDGALARIRESLAGAVSGYVNVSPAVAYLPHVTTAVFGEDVDPARLHDALLPLREAQPAVMHVRRVELLRAWYTGVESGEVPELDTVRSYALRA